MLPCSNAEECRLSRARGTDSHVTKLAFILPLSVFVLCSTLLTSCTRTLVLHIFNDTGKDITVTSYEADRKERHYSIGKGQAERVQISNRLTIALTGIAWDYDVKPVPKNTKYMASEHLGPLLIKLQVETNGTIYILSPDTQGPATAFPPQPPGYPLQPKSRMTK